MRRYLNLSRHQKRVNADQQSYKNNIESLQAEKLRLEIENLDRSFLKVPTFWLSAITAIVAVVGVVAQSQISKLEKQQAQIDRDLAVLERYQVKDEVAELEENRKHLQNSVQDLSIKLEEIDREKNRLEASMSIFLAASDRISKGKTSTEFIKARVEAEKSLIKITISSDRDDTNKVIESAIRSLGYMNTDIAKGESAAIDYNLRELRRLYGESPESKFKVLACKEVHPDRISEILLTLNNLLPDLKWESEFKNETECEAGAIWRIELEEVIEVHPTNLGYLSIFTLRSLG